MSDMVDKIRTVMMPLQMKMKIKLLWYSQSLSLSAHACMLLPLFSCQWYIKLLNVYYIIILFELLGSSKLVQSPLIQELVLLPGHNLASKKGWVGISGELPELMDSLLWLKIKFLSSSFLYSGNQGRKAPRVTFDFAKSPCFDKRPS